jgi:hypothetical protein
MKLKNNGWPYGAAAGLALLFWGGWLWTQPYLPGTDGYYLLDQAGGILKSGALKIQNHDPTPYLAVGMVKCGIPPEVSVKVLLFLGGAAWFWLGRKASPVLFFWLTPLFFFHMIQFPKSSFSILLGVQAFLSLSPWGLASFGIAAFLFHPVGLGCLLLARLGQWKRWAPWAASFALAFGLPLLGHFWRSQVFSFSPVGYKLLMDSHLPLLLRIGVAGWIALLAFSPEKGWLALGFLAPSSQGELVGTPERWMLALLLFSAWVVQDKKGKLFLAPLTPFLAWFLLQQMPRYDYPLMDQVISRSKNLDLKMLVVDQTGKFYFTAKTGQDAYFFEPEDGWRKDSIWRLARQVSPGELLPFMKGACAGGGPTWITLRPDALLIREDCWEEIRAGIRKEENEDLYERVWDHPINPSKKRPAFLRNRQSLENHKKN